MHRSCRLAWLAPKSGCGAGQLVPGPQHVLSGTCLGMRTRGKGIWEELHINTAARHASHSRLTAVPLNNDLMCRIPWPLKMRSCAACGGSAPPCWLLCAGRGCWSRSRGGLAQG